MKEQGFWQLGKRTWKTVVAVFVTLVVDGSRPGAMPFYGAIAAIICVQKTAADSIDAAINREVSTLVGGGFGLLFLLAESWLGHVDLLVLRELLLALALIPIISFSVWMGRQKGTLLMCIVFLSVKLAHGSDINPFDFTLNRIIDTSVGIVTALIVNILPSKIIRRGRRKRQD